MPMLVCWKTREGRREGECLAKKQLRQLWNTDTAPLISTSIMCRKQRMPDRWNKKEGELCTLLQREIPNLDS